MKQSQDEKKTQTEAAHGDHRENTWCDQSQHPSREPLTCEQLETRIHDLMDQRQPLLADSLIRDHVTACEQCAELVVDFGALDDSLSQISLAMLQRLSCVSSAENDQHLRQRLHPFSFVVSIASMVLVALSCGLWFSERPDRALALHRANGAIDAYDSLGSENFVTPLGEIETTSFVSATGPSAASVLNFGHSATTPVDLLGSVNFSELHREVGPYLQMTADLPGISPVKAPVNATYWLLVPQAVGSSESERFPRRSDSEFDESPDLGFRDALAWQLCCV